MKSPFDIKNGTDKQAKEAELQTWIEANSTGFKALNELIEREGLPLECYRVSFP